MEREPLMEKMNRVLEKARRGDDGHAAELERYLEGFGHIVLRGAGKFGSAMGAFLLARGIRRDKLRYWDIRASELGKVNGIKAAKPFSSRFDRERTLIINCIPNGSLSGSAGEQECLSAGYGGCLSGMALFEALMCGMKRASGFDARICLDTTFCNWCACERLPSLLYERCARGKRGASGGKLVPQVATFVINQKCTLKCAHCGQYMNNYPPEESVNFPLERIKKDIDRISGAVDAIGFVSIIGGEPFLHPGLNEIIDHVLAKPNFGVIGVTTNGICRITDEHLRKLKNGRTRLIFSDYTRALSREQRALFNRNVERARESGVSFTVGEPLWSTPATLHGADLSAAAKARMKAGCNSRNSCKTIQNGTYYPCSTAAGLGSHKLEDYPCDWIKIDGTRSAAELRRKIMRLDERAHYESCGHCGGGGELLPLPGEQGRDGRYRRRGKA